MTASAIRVASNPVNLLAVREAIHVVVMGVAGCGKSAVAQHIAERLGLALIEGDSFHSSGNIAKMHNGVALTDEDRAGWLSALGTELRKHPGGAVLTCSALRASYRHTLRCGAPLLRFVHLSITQATALQRVANRPGHFYPPSLVASQFEALQDPRGEPGVMVLDGTLPLAALALLAAQWLEQPLKFEPITFT